MTQNEPDRRRFAFAESLSTVTDPQAVLPHGKVALLLPYAALAAIAVAAIVLRFWDLASNPGGLYGDEAAEGLDAWRLLHVPGFHADFGVWFTSDGGREALFAYVAAAVFQLFGASVLALRATAAAFGVAGVLAIGHLGRRVAGGVGGGAAGARGGPAALWAGVAAAAWAAGSLWLVAISRDGMRNAIVPLFGAVALVALLRWAERPGTGRAATAGAVTSLAAVYTYQPLKLLPLVAIVWVLWLRHADRARYEALRKDAVPFLAAFLIVAAPMIAVAVTNPANYFGRVASTSPFNPDVNATSDPITHVIRTILMFGFTGDPNPRHDVAGLPLLPLPLVLLAALGTWRLWRNRADAAHSLILVSLPVFFVAPLVAVEGGSPHFLRSLGLAAPLGVAIGLGALELVARVARLTQRTSARDDRRRLNATAVLAGGVVAVTLTAIAVWSGWAYLSRPVADRYTAFSYPIVSLANLAADHPGSAVILDDYSAMDVEFLDAANPPAILPPKVAVADPRAHPLYFALSLADIRSTLGPDAAARATAVAWDPSGKPVVWSVTP